MDVVISRTNALGCPNCGSSVGASIYDDWACADCGTEMPDRPPTFAELGLDLEEERQKREARAQGLSDWAAHRRTGPGEWGSGHTIFQLPADAPDRVAYSMQEMESTYRKYGIDPDTHRYKDGQGPASPNQRRRNGSLRIDNYDRDHGV